MRPREKPNGGRPPPPTGQGGGLDVVGILGVGAVVELLIDGRRRFFHCRQAPGESFSFETVDGEEMLAPDHELREAARELLDAVRKLAANINKRAEWVRLEAAEKRLKRALR